MKSTARLSLAACLIASALMSPSVFSEDAKPFPVKLPFPTGTKCTVNQGNFGKFSHNTALNAYAWDFSLPERSLVTAAAAGRVVDLKQDGKTGGPSPIYFSTNNYVVIDHGGGHFTKYMHLHYNSARIKIGEVVHAGQVIALSGSTGFATSAHLHFEVSDCTGNSQPATFVDFAGRGGVPLEGDACKSGPVTADVDTFTEDTPLPKNAFADNGIELTAALPSRVFEEGRSYHIKGKASQSGDRVYLYLMPKTSFDTVNEFGTALAADGTFDYSVKLKLPVVDGVAASENYRLTLVVMDKEGSFKSHVNVPIYVTAETPKSEPVTLAPALLLRIDQR